MDTLWACKEEVPALFDRAQLAVRHARPQTFVAALLSALFVFGLTFAFVPGQVEGATPLASACGVNLRTGASTGNAIKTSVRTGTTITVVATVSGGSWRATCAGKSVSGN